VSVPEIAEHFALQDSSQNIGCRDGLKDIPMLDDLAFAVEAKDVNACSFLAGPIQITHVYEGKIPVDGNTFHLAGNAAGLLDVGNDAVEPCCSPKLQPTVKSIT
jgi:hypothetical protein